MVAHSGAKDMTDPRDIDSAEKGLEGQSHAEDTTPQNSSVADMEKEVDPENGIDNSSSSSSSHGDVPAEKEASVAGQRPPLERTESQAQKFGKTRIFMIVLSLCIALFLAALDMTIITTALPTIADHFHASQADYTWVGSSYLLASASSVPAWGKFSDIFGRKPMLLLCNIIFMAGSLFCALSTSIGMLIGARVLQGVGGGGLFILVNIVVSDLFSLRERGKYIGIFGMIWAIASAVGPIVGGVLAQKVSWRWCFYINLPLDGFSLIMLTVYLKIHTPKTPLLAGLQAIDWLGVLLIVAGVVMFLLGLESGGVTRPWDSAYTLCLIIFGIVTVALFFVVEWKIAKYPVIPLRLFKNRTRCFCLLTAFSHGMVFIAASYFLPLYFQTVLAATPLMSGIYTFPFIITLSIVSAGGGILIKKTGKYQLLIVGGMVIMTLGFGLFIDLPSNASWARIVMYQIIAGIGVGPNFQAPLVALQTTINPSDIATATATFGFVRQIATSLSVVLGGVVFQNQLAKQQDYLRTHLDGNAALASRLSSASTASSSAGLIRTLPASQRRVIAVAITSSLRIMWIFYVVIAALGIVFSLFVGKKVLSKEVHIQQHGLEAQEKARLERLEKERLKKEEKVERKRKSTDAGLNA